MLKLTIENLLIKKASYNIVLAKDGVNIVVENPVNNIRKNAFHISFFCNLEICKSILLRFGFSLEIVCKVARSSPILFPLCAMLPKYGLKILNNMNGKIKLKLNQKSSINNNTYEIFIDDKFVGNVDYKNPKLDFVTNLGNHKILVKGKDFEKEHNFILSSRKIIVPIEINENLFWTKTSVELPKLMNGFLIGLLLVYTLVITFLLYTKDIEFKYPLIIPLALLLFSNAFSQKQKFQLNFK